MNQKSLIATGALLCLCSAGCIGSSTTETAIADNRQFTLASEPPGACDVMDFRDQAKDGQLVVVLGRVGGGVKPWIDGRAAFLLVDERVSASCDDDQCEEDCVQCAQQLAEATTLVKFVDEQGKVLPVDARALLGVKEQQTVVIRGVASRDKAGNVSIAADGIYVRR